MDPFIGEIKLLGFQFNPTGWAHCMGQLMSISQNQALFSLIGTYYGGDGRTTYALPDLRGRTPRGQGTGPGLGTVNMGEQAGMEYQSLSLNEMPPHNHPASFVPDPSHPPHTQAATDAANTAAPEEGAYLANGKVNLNDDVRSYFSGSPSGIVNLGGGVAGSGSVNVDPSGGGSPFSTMNPYLGMNFSIALQGIFPTRD
ncbi:MAG: tail fiber protein [Pseudomonadota bacterium]